MDRKRTASIALIVILLACTIAIVAFVMSNGTTPVGPASAPAVIINDIDVSQSGTVQATNIDDLNFADGNFIVTESPDAQANVSLADSVTVVNNVTTDTISFGTDLNNCNSAIDQILIASAGEIRSCARGNISLIVDTNNNGTNCVRFIGTSTNLLSEICEGNVTIINGIVRVNPQSISCVDSGGPGPGALTLLPTLTTILVTVLDAGGCNVTFSEVGMVVGNQALVVNISANDLFFPDIPGVQETPNGITITQMQWESSFWIYLADRWTAVGT